MIAGKVEQDTAAPLGEKASQISKRMTQYVGKAGYYKSDFGAEQQNLCTELATLAKECPPDFITLITINDFAKYFFVEVMQTSAEAKKVFLDAASYDQLSYYTWKILAHYEEKLKHRYNIQDITKYNSIISSIKETISTVIECMSQKTLSIDEQNKLYATILRSLFASYDKFTEEDKASVKEQIKNLLGILNDDSRNYKERYPFLGSAIDISLDLATWILAANSNIPETSPRYRDVTSLTALTRTRIRDDFNNKDRINLLTTFLQQTEAPMQALDTCLQNAILSNHAYAIKPLIAELQKHKEWNKLSHISRIYEGYGQPGSASYNQTIKGYMAYLNAINISVYDALKHIEKLIRDALAISQPSNDTASSAKPTQNAQAKPTQYAHLEEALNILMCDIGEKYATPSNFDNFYNHEAKQKKGLFYFLAESPHLISKMQAGILRYLSQRFAVSNTRVTTYCGLWSAQRPDTPLVADMFSRNDPNYCPITHAAEQKNVPFLLLALEIIKDAEVSISPAFKEKVKTAILELVSNKADTKGIQEFLEAPYNCRNVTYVWYASKLNEAIKWQIKMAIHDAGLDNPAPTRVALAPT